MNAWKIEMIQYTIRTRDNVITVTISNFLVYNLNPKEWEFILFNFIVAYTEDALNLILLWHTLKMH